MPGSHRRIVRLITTALSVSSALLVAAGVSAARDLPVPGTWESQIVAAPVMTPESPAAPARFVASPAVAETATLGVLVAARYLPRSLPPGVGSERGLQIKTILVERAVSAHFPEITNIGGVRPDGMRWHPEGLAVDVMIPEWDTPAGKALGDRILKFALDNAARFGLVHVIWQQTYYPIDGPAHAMANLGSPDANHYTHVHIATSGGGYPNGGEHYLG